MMNDFYTYAYLREDRTPYYIGKGKKDRIHSTCRRNKPPKDKSRIIFLKQNLTEEEAFKHEIYMIAVFGRKDLGTGILRNLTDGGEGASGMGTPEQRSDRARKVAASLTSEQRSKIVRKLAEGRARMTPEQRSEAAKKGQATRTPEQRSEVAKKGQATRTLEQKSEALRNLAEGRARMARMTPEQRSELVRKGQATKTPEQRSEASRKGNAQKFQCTETGYITNAGALSKYQKARGIDTSKRKKLSE
jgi:hypothetical protein